MNTLSNFNHFLIKLKGSALFRDSFWALTGNALGKGLALVAGIAVARFLGSTEYGEYGLIKGTLLSIAIFSSFGLGYTATKFIAECRLNNIHRAKQIHNLNTVITLCTSAFIALAVAVFAGPIAEWLDDASLSGILRWSSIAIVFNAIITTQAGELSGFRAYKIVARNNIIAGVMTFLCVAPGAYWGGLKWAVIALVFTLFCNCIINAVSIRNLLPENRGNGGTSNRSLAKEILAFSLPIALQESLYSITSWLGMAMLIKLSNYSELGLYSAANQWMAVMLFIPGALRNVALSHLSENSDNDEASDRITKRLLLVNLVSTFVPFVIIALSSSLIASFYGTSFAKLPLVLNICIFTAVVNSMTNVLTQELIAHSQNWYLFWTRLLRDSLALIIGYCLLSIFKENGAIYFASSYLFTQMVYLILLTVKRKLIYKHLK